jgi:Tfp pilus assembly protein PilX
MANLYSSEMKFLRHGSVRGATILFAMIFLAIMSLLVMSLLSFYFLELKMSLNYYDQMVAFNYAGSLLRKIKNDFINGYCMSAIGNNQYGHYVIHRMHKESHIFSVEVTGKFNSAECRILVNLDCQN